MQSIKLKSKGKIITLNLPTEFKEVTPKYLLDVTNHVVVSPDYSLVALVYKEKISSIVNSSKKSGPMNTTVVPIFVKAGDTDSSFIQYLKEGTALIVPGSDLEMGIHVNSIYNSISINNVIGLINIDESKSVLIHPFEYTIPSFFVEFKLVPNCSIHGAMEDINYSGDKYNFISEEEDPDYIKEEPSVLTNPMIKSTKNNGNVGTRLIKPKAN